MFAYHVTVNSQSEFSLNELTERALFEGQEPWPSGYGREDSRPRG